MLKNKWLNLQLFSGEGAGSGTGSDAGTGEGNGEGASTGDNAIADAEQRLRDLGVPSDKAKRRASKVASAMSAKSVNTARTAQGEETSAVSAPADELSPTEGKKTDAPARMSWDDIMADPEYNKQMQAVVQSRLRNVKSAEDALSKLAPALEVLARKHGIDPQNMDYDALSKAINDDSGYYEDKALQMGVSIEAAKKIDQIERDNARLKAQEEKQKMQEARTLKEQKFREHIAGLEKQGEAMKKVFPSFDLRKELQNPTFARMTSPGGGISVEDAYYAVHRNEIQLAAMQATQRQTAQKISNAIQSGSRRPQEAGTSSQAPTVSAVDYRAMTKEQRDTVKRQIYYAKAQGKKLYPGQIKF